MNTKRQHILLIVVTAFVIVAGSFCIIKYNLQHKKTIEQVTDYTQLILGKVNELEREHIGKSINNQFVFWGNDSLHVYELYDVAADDILYFYFSENTCPPCILQTIDIIKQHIPGYENDERIIFVSPDCPVRFRENCHGKRLLSLQTKALGIPVKRKMSLSFSG